MLPTQSKILLSVWFHFAHSPLVCSDSRFFFPVYISLYRLLSLALRNTVCADISKSFMSFEVPGVSRARGSSYSYYFFKLIGGMFNERACTYLVLSLHPVTQTTVWNNGLHVPIICPFYSSVCFSFSHRWCYLRKQNLAAKRMRFTGMYQTPRVSSSRLLYLSRLSEDGKWQHLSQSF